MAGGLPINSAPISITLAQDNHHERLEMEERHESGHENGRASELAWDLNDHRLQPSSLPRANSDAHPRRGTLASIYADHPELLQVDTAAPVARDFEVAITDDERSINSPEGPITPGGRKNTFSRRKRTQSRDSSRSSSTSPPTSVHAFAERSNRRRRAGTVTSNKAPSLNSLHRTISGGTHRRRPTFSEKGDDVQSNERDVHAEDDVCFPPSDEEEEGSIDYEDLEEFVAENEQARPVADIVPKITREAPTPERRPSTPHITSDEDLAELEKHRAQEKRPESAASRRGSQVDAARRLWTFFSSDFDDAIHSTTIGGLLEDGDTFQNLFELKTESGCYWLDGLNPTEDEVTALCKAFGVHPLTREDIVTQESREKVEIFKKYYFVSFRSFNQDKDSEEFLEPINIYAVVFRHGLLSFTFAQKNSHTGNVLKRIGKLRDYMQLSADWICYALIDDIVDSFNPFVHDVEQEVDAIEDQVFISRAEDARSILHSISEARKKVMCILRLLGTKSDVIKGFAKRCNEGFEAAPRGDVGLYLSDIQDHVLTMRDNLTHSEQLLSRVHNNYLAQLNVDHISSGNRVNKILSKITLLASILVPLNLVTGLFGMNVPVPGRESANLGWFFGIVGFLVTFIVVSIVISRRMRFI
jgi:magnesium transporter